MSRKLFYSPVFFSSKGKRDEMGSIQACISSFSFNCFWGLWYCEFLILKLQRKINLTKWKKQPELLHKKIYYIQGLLLCSFCIIQANSSADGTKKKSTPSFFYFQKYAVGKFDKVNTWSKISLLTTVSFIQDSTEKLVF